MSDDRPILTIGHSPDPDDAFMWWPLGTPDEPGTIDTGEFRFQAVPADIEALNQRAINDGDLDITAISMHTYPHVNDRYVLTSCGSSMGDGYGPKVLALESHDPEWLLTPDVRIAVPGEKTTAFLTLRLLLGRDFRYEVLPFHEIVDAVLSRRVEAGLIIHEAQLSYPDSGLDLIVDLGDWWNRQTSLPLPLGGNAIRRDLDDRFGPGTMARITSILLGSIRHARAERPRSVAYAMQFAHDQETERVERFIDMYVDELTLDMGERGRLAIQRLLGEACIAGLTPPPGPIEPVSPAVG